MSHPTPEQVNEARWVLDRLFDLKIQLDTAGLTLSQKQREEKKKQIAKEWYDAGVPAGSFEAILRALK